MKKSVLLLGGLALTVLGFQNCKTDAHISPTEKKLVLPTTPYGYKQEVDAFMKDLAFIASPSFKNSGNVFVDNTGNQQFIPNGLNFNTTQIHDDVATLGRVLFYDTKMSINNTIACGSCHLQSKAFSDVGSGSVGFKGIATTRNSMAIANPMLTRNLFWDTRTKSLQDMVLQPVQNHIEMGMENLDFLKTKLQNTTYYPQLFKNAFGTEGVTKEGINAALMQFLASMVSHNSKFDAGAKAKFSNFNELETMGHALFNSERLSCAKCHAGANFSLADENTFDNPYGGSSGAEGTANIGLNMVYQDNGRGNGKFKIPSLRNVELSAPYMHDGRFKTLDEVVEHYNKGIQFHPSLDANLKDAKGEPKRLNLTNLEKTALIAFLQTLTDKTYTTDVKYSDPFRD
jgi:cytochrome c peroxidase